MITKSIVPNPDYSSSRPLFRLDLQAIALLSVLLLFISSNSPVHAEDASLNGAVITMPVVVVGITFYRVELTLIADTNPPEFNVTGGVEIAGASRVGASTLTGSTLTIPAIQVGDVNYLVQLTLSNSNPYQFRLTGVEVNEPSLGSVEPRQEALDLFDQHLAGQVVQTRCIVCHVAGGLARDTRLVFQRTNVASTQNNFETFSSFLEGDNGSSNTILTKVAGGNHVGGIQLVTGSADYNTLADFLALLDESLDISSPSGSTVDFFAGVVLETREETLRRASIMLTARNPSDTERASVRNGDDDLRVALRGLMQGDGFHQFILEGTNDRLLTASAKEIVNGGLRNYPIYRNTTFELEVLERETGESLVGEFIATVEGALAVAPGELIAYITENDRPYTEVVTANYMMMNPIVNSMLGGTAQFNDEEDAFEFQPGVIDGYYFTDGSLIAIEDEFSNWYVEDPGTGHFTYPHAGIINTPAFLARYPTTATNRNRARARWTFFHFLDIDIEKSSQRPTDPEALADTNNPTLYNPNCTPCHETMDPVAGAFQNYDEFGFYRRDGIDALDVFYKYPIDGSTTPYQFGDTWYRGMRAPGLFDRQITDNVYTLQELAQQIVLEPGFARASVKFWWSSIMGSKVLLAPAVTEDNGYQAQLLAYEAQTATIEELAQDFSSHFNLKDLLVEMMMTPWFSAETVDDNTNIEAHIFAELGSEKLLTPERLQRKTLALTGFNWDSRPRKATTLDDLRTGFEYTYRLYYGGIDSLGITERSTEMTPLMSTVPMSAAAESSCPIVLKEFALADEERKLFFGITDLETPLLEANWETSVDSAEYGDWKDFSLNATVAAGEKIALVTFSNPYCDFDEVNKVCLEQRRLYLDYLSVKTPGQSTFTRYEADDSAVTISGCWLRGPEANDAVLDESCSVSLPISIATSGNLEIRVALSAMQGGDELPKARIALLDTVDPHESQSAGAVTIREKLAELHQILLGKTYAADSPEIAIAYNLLVDSWVEHESDGFATNLMHTGYQCRWDSDFTYFDNLDFADEGFVLNDAGFWFDGNVNVVFPFLVSIADDPQRMKRSWIVVMTYLMTHYHYLYE